MAASGPHSLLALVITLPTWDLSIAKTLDWMLMSTHSSSIPVACCGFHGPYAWPVALTADHDGE